MASGIDLNRLSGHDELGMLARLSKGLGYRHLSLVSNFAEVRRLGQLGAELLDGAHSEVALQKFDQAFAVLDEASDGLIAGQLNMTRTELRAWLHFFRGKAFQAANRLVEARADLDASVWHLEEIRSALGAAFSQARMYTLAGTLLDRGDLLSGAPFQLLPAAIADYDAAIGLFRRLSEKSVELPDDWRRTLARLHLQRGVAKHRISPSSLAAPLEDYDTAIRHLDDLKSKLGEGFPNIWQHQLAHAYYNRGLAREAASGPEAAADDYEAAVSDLDMLLGRTTGEVPRDWLQLMADASGKRADTTDALRGAVGRRVADQTHAIMALENLRSRSGGAFTDSNMLALASAYHARGLSRESSPSHGVQAAIDDFSSAIEWLETVRSRSTEASAKTTTVLLAAAYVNRGGAHTKRPPGVLLSMNDFDCAIRLLEKIRSESHGQIDHHVALVLTRAYARRGASKRASVKYGPHAALSDYDAAINLLRSICAESDGTDRDNLVEALADAYDGRGATKKIAVGYGNAAAVADHSAAIRLMESAARRDPSRLSAEFLFSLACSYGNRADAIHSVNPGDASAAGDIAIAIEMLEALCSGKRGEVSYRWVRALAAASGNRSIVDAHSLTPGEKMRVQDKVIASLEALQLSLGLALPEDWSITLASAHARRAEIGGAQPDAAWDAGLSDLTRSIELVEGLRAVTTGEVEDRFLVLLAGFYFNRGVALYKSPEDNGPLVLADLRSALALWSLPSVRIVAQEYWIRCNYMLAIVLVQLDRHAEALEHVKSAGDSRLELVSQSVTLAEQREALKAGSSIAGLGAWLLARAGRAREGLAFLESQQAVMLKEALLRDEQTLIPRVGAAAAANIVAIRERILSVRNTLAQPFSAGGLLTSDFDPPMLGDALREQLLGLKAQFDKAVAETGANLRADALGIADLAQLAPAGGVIAVPVVTPFGSCAFVLSRKGVVQTLDLPDLKQEQVDARVGTLLQAEADYIEALTGDTSGTASVSDPVAVFEEVLQSEARAYWVDLMGPLWTFLSANGHRTSAPLTLVVTGALDSLPLHIAARDANSVSRHAIEDRVIRYAPSFAALRQMKTRSRREAVAAKRVLGVFAPQKEGLKQLDLPGSLGKEQRTLKMLVGESLVAVQKSAATRDWFLAELQARDRPITDLHLSMHSEFDPKHPERTRLKFVDAEGNWVWVSVQELLQLGEVRWLRQVCLASCQSGRSDTKAMPGEAIGLVAAFIQAGASSVLSAAYAILDDGAAKFIPALYRRRLAGEDLAEALRGEVCELLANRQVQQDGVRSGGAVPAATVETPPQGDSAQFVGGVRMRPGGSRARPLGLVDWAAYKPSTA